ncbi:DUF4381 domain-containing protein [Halopseudomonas pelagia]|uniref:DUF4381 domain-containing protein n=1 Tax=Halopseudomonas pelagia TaxID=553151 RepID=UPI0003A0F3B2|nr:DUF4381 domain-containing protein [Halopseudomonas pelagia]
MTEALLNTLIHPAAPAPIPWWPPAPGWWLVLGAVCLLSLTAPFLLMRWRRRSAIKLRAQQALRDIPATLTDQQWLAEVNTLLKRLLKQRGDAAATRLFGQAWLDYLCAHYPRPQRRSLEPLAADLYRKTPQLSAQQRRDLHRELRRWLRHNHA